MKILIAEDDYASRNSIRNFLKQFGDCDITIDGMEASDAYLMALEDGNPYDLVCLDVMMPVMDGYQALESIRNIEKSHGISGKDATKIIMSTALNEEKNVQKAYELGCTTYLAKPIDLELLKKALLKLELIKE
ncbi:MAG TPA: response regulator [Lachnospiraceae bacterium]|nr:response regulator [Lachnospiraceae bacterium]